VEVEGAGPAPREAAVAAAAALWAAAPTPGGRAWCLVHRLHQAAMVLRLHHGGLVLQDTLVPWIVRWCCT